MNILRNIDVNEKKRANENRKLLQLKTIEIGTCTEQYPLCIAVSRHSGLFSKLFIAFDVIFFVFPIVSSLKIYGYAFRTLLHTQ